MTFSVVVNGRLQPGVSRDQARQALAALFKVQDAARLDRYFSGADIVIKSGLDAAQAERYRRALEQAGLEAEVRRQDAPLLEIPAPPPATATEPAAPAETVIPAPVARHAPDPVAPSTPQPAPATPESPAVWWHIRQDGRREGPFSREQMNARAAAGDITAFDRIWKPGLKDPLTPGSLSWLKLPEAMAVSHAYSAPRAAMLEVPDAPSPPNRIVMVSAALLLAINFLVALSHAAMHDTAGNIGYALGSSVVWPLIFVVVGAIGPSQRTAAARARLFLYGSLFCTFGLLVGLAGGKLEARHLASGEVSDEELAIVVAVQNRHLPTMVDTITRLDRLTLDHRELTYNYTIIDRRASEMNATFTEIMQSLVTRKSCRNKDMVRMMAHGISYRFSYYGKDQEPIGSFAVREGDCAATPAPAGNPAASNPATP